MPPHILRRHLFCKNFMKNNKKYNMVACDFCKSYDDKARYFNECSQCNGTRIVRDPKDILCNMCGESMCMLNSHNSQSPYGLYEANVMGQYNSYHLFDLTTYKFSICEKCLRVMFNQFKIKPEVFGIEDGNFEEDQEAYEYRLWCDNGGHHKAYLERKCNIIKDCNNIAEYSELVNGEFSESCCCEEHKSKIFFTENLIKFVCNELKPFL